MRKIVYYVAVSLDGYIAGPNEKMDKWVSAGPGVDYYLNDLKNFDTVIMGRRTYEYGYQFGLKPGTPAYPHMRHYIFSNTMQLENPHEKVKVVGHDLELVKALKAEEGTDIYLCGGGLFAGWLLDNQLIDVLKIKLNPIVFGGGIPLFGGSKTSLTLKLKEQLNFEGGLMILTYDF